MTLNVRVTGTANLTQMRAEFAALEGQIAALNAQMAKMVGPGGVINPQGYRDATKSIAQNSRVWRDAANSTGMFEAGQLRINSATDEYIKKLEKQKLSFRDLAKSQRVATAAYHEQLRMQQMLVRQVPGSTRGMKGAVDFSIPTQVHKDWDTLGNRIGFAREQLRSASTQMVNWGKNTQWAGRQLMVGFTMPVAAFGAAAGVMSYQVDKQLTRIRKVYDTTFDQNSKNVKEHMRVTQEFAQLNADSMTTAENAARQYGASVNETLDIVAQLAATGKRGAELQESATQVQRIATLGEIDHQTALDATISLQSVLNMNTTELAKTFDYMNSVENATSLATEDFAKAIPIALGPLKEMGGNVKDLAVMLVAMRQNGIAASQGANAIKAMMQRLYRPSKQIREEWQAITNTDITDIRDRNGGDIMKMLKDIADATANLNRQEKVQVIGGLIGTYQVGRVNAVLDGIREMNAGIGQTSKVLEINRQGWQKWHQTAENELAQFQQSASGMFKRSIATLQAELAQAGEPFLEVASKAVNAITWIISKFNELPDAAKKTIIFGAIIGALVGPVVMLVGLFANFAGNILKFAVAATRAAGHMEILNRESMIAKAAAGFAEAGFISEGAAIQALTRDIEMYTKAQIVANKQTLAGTTTGAVIGGAPAKYSKDFTSAKPGNFSLLPVGGAQKIEESTQKTNTAMRGVAASSTVFAGAMAASLISSNESVDNFANMAMIATVMMPLLSGGFLAMRGAVAAATLAISTRMAAAVTAIGGSTASWMRIFSQAPGIAGKTSFALRSAGSGILALVGPVGLLVAGMAAIAGSAYLIWKHGQKAAEEYKSIHDNVDPMAEILGYTPKATADLGSAAAKTADAVQKTAEAYPALISKIKNAKDDQEAFNTAMELGLQVLNSGGTAQQARKAVELALKAAKNDAEAERITLHFKGRLDFDNGDALRQIAADSAQKALDEAARTAGDRSYGQTVANFLVGPNHDPQGLLSSQAQAAVKVAGQRIKQSYLAGLKSNPETASQLLFSEIDESLDKIDKGIANSTGQQKQDYEQLREAFMRNVVETFGSGEKAANALDREWLKNADTLMLLNHTTVEVDRNQRIAYLQNLQRTKGLNAAQRERLNLLISERDLLAQTANAGKIHNLIFKQGGNAAKDIPPFLQSAANYADDLAGNSKKAAVALDQGRSAADRLGNAIREAYNQADWSGAYRGAVESTLGQLGEIASDNFQNKMDDALDSYRANQQARVDAMQAAHENASSRLENRQEAATRRFESRWERRKDAVNKAFDVRIDRIDKEIKAEQRAEDIRQRIFEAEKTRLQRVNEMANRTIDFNMALDTGDLDEAAKIRNDMQAQEAEWNLDDAAEAGKRKADREIERLENRKEKIEEVRDARIKALEKVEDAEKRALERSQDRQKKALDRQQKIQEAALDKEVDNNIAAQEEIWENRKENLDRAIENFQKFVPKNEKDLKDHVRRVSERYKDFNVDTRGKFNETAVNIGRMLWQNVRDAARDIKTDIGWASVGQGAAKEIIAGAFGMTIPQFKNFMSGGDWPEGAGPLSAKDARNRNNSTRGSSSGGIRGGQQIDAGVHSGGFIGGAKLPWDRSGYARTAPQHRNEVTGLLERGEYVVNKDAAARNRDVLEQINSGGFSNSRSNIGYGVGGPGKLGFAGLLMAGAGQALKNMVGIGLKTAVKRKKQQATAGAFGAIKAGTYGDRSFSKSQLGNARLIADVGKQMRMSPRDIQVAIMTAITESGLINNPGGDRDSAGLFQQRPSQGWGSYAQVTDPVYASRTFYNRLKRLGGRDARLPWYVAQDIQRSAWDGDPYPYGGNYKANWNEAQSIYRAMQKNQGDTAKFRQGGGGWHQPSVPGKGWSNSHDYRNGLGSPLYAYNSGKVIESRAITSGGSAGNGLYSTPYRSYGETIVVRGSDGSTVRYAHLSPGQRFVRVGQMVEGGALIGRSGNTGNSSGPHTHFEANGSEMAREWFATHGIGLAKGAANINVEGLYKLHKDEAVLTDDLNRKFHQGVENFANGPSNSYNVNVNVTEPGASADEIANKVMQKLKWAENRRPQSRSR